MIGWRSPRVPFYFHAKLRPTLSVQPVNELGYEPPRMVQRQQLVQRRRQQPYLLPVHISKGHLLSTSVSVAHSLHCGFPLTFETGSFYGSRRMKASLERQGMPASRKRVQRLMSLMGLRAIYRQPRTSQPAAGRWVYPYLLRDLTITRANQVWAADITYLPMARGFLYLVAIMDWHSRYVVAWGLSNTLDACFCAEALTEALNQGRPDVFNTDQGSQFTSREFTQILQDHSVKISMDGRGRYQDNILVERLWRTVKYEEVYLKAYANGLEARRGLREYFRFYNHRRPHQALGYRTPAEVFHGEPVEEELKERRCPDQRVLVSYEGVQESHLIVA